MPRAVLTAGVIEDVDLHHAVDRQGGVDALKRIGEVSDVLQTAQEQLGQKTGNRGGVGGDLALEPTDAGCELCERGGEEAGEGLASVAAVPLPFRDDAKKVVVREHVGWGVAGDDVDVVHAAEFVAQVRERTELLAQLVDLGA